MHSYVLHAVLYKYICSVNRCQELRCVCKHAEDVRHTFMLLWRVCCLTCVSGSHMMLLYSVFGQWMQLNGPDFVCTDW